jgi:hypothetical protein
MEGDDSRRYCARCDRHVHNLSAMSERKRAAFITRAGRQICIAYLQRRDGSLVLPSRWKRFHHFLQVVQVGIVSALAAMLPFAFTGCANRASASKASMACDTHQQKSAKMIDEGEMVPGEGPAFPDPANTRRR